MNIPIIIPFVTVRYLPECIASIERCTTDIPHEIILVNDGSTEPELLSFLCSTSYRVITLDTNRGVAAACNAGIRAATEGSVPPPYLMIINADTEVTPGWLGKLVALLEADPDLAAVGPVILDHPASQPHSSEYPSSQRGDEKITGRIQQAGCAWDGSGFHIDLAGIDLSTIPYVPTRCCDAIGGIVLFRRDPLFDVGLFDEAYLNSCEDMAICLDLRERGYRIAVCGESFVYHHGGVGRYRVAMTNLEASHLRFFTTWTSDRIASLPSATAIRTIALVGAFAESWRAEHHLASALEELGLRVNRFNHRTGEAEQAAMTPADLTLVLKGDGIPPDLINRFPKPTILWYSELLPPSPGCTESHALSNYAVLAQNVRAFDVVICHDRTALQTLKNMGASHVACIPGSGGVNPKLHRKLGIEKRHDIGFFGSLSPRREKILDTLREQGIDVSVSEVWGEALNRFINECRICLNIHDTGLLNTETRLPEVLGAGTFCLSEEISLPEMYSDGQHLVYWKPGDIDDLVMKIRHYLDHPDERERIAASGHGMAHERDTYTHRCRTLLSLAGYHFRYLSGYHLGIPLDKDGYPTLDLNEFEKAIELAVSHDYPYAHYHHGNLTLRYDDMAGAASSYRQAISLDPALHEARYGLALALFRLGEDTETLVHLSALPSDRYPDALKLMATLYRRLNRSDDAIRCIEEYLRLHPGSPDAGSLRGELEHLRRE